jgi:hypothetical protein
MLGGYSFSCNSGIQCAAMFLIQLLWRGVEGWHIHEQASTSTSFNDAKDLTQQQSTIHFNRGHIRDFLTLQRYCSA